MSAPTTATLLAVLRATGLPTGDARAPAGAGWQGGAGSSAFVSYLVLYPLDASRQGPDAPLGDRMAAPQWNYQLTAVGRDRLSAETASDIAARALLAPGLTLDGEVPVALVHTAGLGVSADEELNPPLFYAVDRYRLEP